MYIGKLLILGYFKKRLEFLGFVFVIVCLFVWDMDKLYNKFFYYWYNIFGGIKKNIYLKDCVVEEILWSGFFL